jgi:hypothetical protein
VVAKIRNHDAHGLDVAAGLRPHNQLEALAEEDVGRAPGERGALHAHVGRAEELDAVLRVVRLGRHVLRKVSESKKGVRAADFIRVGARDHDATVRDEGGDAVIKSTQESATLRQNAQTNLGILEDGIFLLMRLLRGLVGSYSTPR